MLPARWKLVRDIVADALAVHERERARWLEVRCGNDTELRNECASLLAQESRVDAVLGSNASAVEALAHEPTQTNASELLGLRAGAWTIVAELGRGGMGAVFLAERAGDGFVQRGALKVLAGPQNTSTRDRFRVEQRALARLEHADIARLIDSGELEDGRPYLVMELVDGQPIDRFCAERASPLADRIELVARVCDAVHHAHQSLVVHRDLKPSNVLVDSNGRPHVVDFGIARVLELDPSSETSPDHSRAYTPRYASPEQARGENVSTASDVYSLGVILYELLTGASPYPGATRSTFDLLRAVRENDPHPPSVAASEHDSAPFPAARLRGDLDAIALCALAKAPENRYASAGEFALDLRRHLRGEAVRARPDTFTYRLTKLLGRHRIAGVFAAAALVSLAAGTLVSTRAYFEARDANRREREARQRAETLYEQARAATEGEAAQRDLAEQRYRDVRELARALVFDAHDAIRALPGATRARETLLESARELLERLEAHGVDDPELLVDLARSYTRLGDVRGRAAEASVGRVDSAEFAYQRAVALAERVDTREARYTEALARAKLGELLTSEGRLDTARSELERALALRKALLELDPLAWAADPNLGYLEERLFDLALAAGSLDAAQRHLEDSARFLEDAAQGPTHTLLWRENNAVLQRHFGRLAELRREFERALEHRQSAVNAFSGLVADAPERVWNRQRLAQARGELGSLLTRLGRSDEASLQLDQTHAEQLELLTLDPASAVYRTDLAMTKIHRAELAARRGEHEEALVWFREALELRRNLAEADPTSSRALRAHAIAADQTGGALRELRRFDEAYECHVEAARIFEALSTLPGAGPDARRSVAVSSFALGKLQRARAESAETPSETAALWTSAREHFARSLSVLEELAAANLLAPRDANVPADLRTEIAACDRALAQ